MYEAAMAALLVPFVVPFVVDGGGGDGVELDEAAVTVMSTFIPPRQWPAMPQMKYRPPVVFNGMVLLPPVYVCNALLVEHEVYADSLTSSTSWLVDKYVKTAVNQN